MPWKWRPWCLLANPLAIAWPMMAKRPRTCNTIESSIVDPLIVESTLVTRAQICRDRDPSAKTGSIDGQLTRIWMSRCCDISLRRLARHVADDFSIVQSVYNARLEINRDASTNTGAKTICILASLGRKPLSSFGIPIVRFEQKACDVR